jgi:GT2 family glycosyltransferase
LLDKNESDVLNPYATVINVSGQLKQAFMAEPSYRFFESLEVDNLPQDANILYPSANGGIIFFRRKDYIRVGGHNSRLEGWGGEDDEMLQRSRRLGIRWHCMTAPILVHLHHDSSSRTEWIDRSRESDNTKASETAGTMPLEELEALSSELAKFFEGS